MKAELAKENGDVTVVWKRLRKTDLQITEWRGTSAFVSAPTGPGVADYVQIVLVRESDGAPVRRQPGLSTLGRTGTARSKPARTDHSRTRISSPVRLSPPRPRRRRGGPRPQFSRSLGRIERDKREAKRPELERRVVREVGPGGTHETPFLAAVPDYFDFVPSETAVLSGLGGIER